MKMMNIQFLENIKNNPKQLAGIIIASALVAVLFYFNFILKPQVLQAASLVMNMNKMRADLKKAESDIAEIPKFKNDIRTYEDKVAYYEKMLPAEREIPSLLQSLSEMAKNSNVKIIGITPTVMEGEKGTIYQELPILISAKSGYHELGRFLSSLENSERFIKVADISIRSNSANPKKHDVESLVVTYILLKER